MADNEFAVRHPGQLLGLQANAGIVLGRDHGAFVFPVQVLWWGRQPRHRALQGQGVARGQPHHRRARDRGLGSS